MTKKLTPAQQKVLDKIRKEVATFKKYATFKEFFETNKGEQNAITTAWHVQYKTAEEYKAKAPEYAEDTEKAFYEFKENNRTLAVAKTETLQCLEKAGYIKIIEKGWHCEKVELLER